MAGGTLIVLFIGLLGIVLGFKPIMKRAGKRSQILDTQKFKLVGQIVAGIKEIYVMQRRKTFLDKYTNVSNGLQKAKRTVDFVNSCPDRIIEGICVGGMIGVICLRLNMIEGGEDFVAKLGVLAMVAFKILPSAGKTTVADIFLGLLIPKIGKVEVNGRYIFDSPF